MISWVFFDLGGTLLDDGPVHDLVNRKLVELLDEPLLLRQPEVHGRTEARLRVGRV